MDILWINVFKMFIMWCFVKKVLQFRVKSFIFTNHKMFATSLILNVTDKYFKNFESRSIWNVDNHQIFWPVSFLLTLFSFGFVTLFNSFDKIVGIQSFLQVIFYVLNMYKAMKHHLPLLYTIVYTSITTSQKFELKIRSHSGNVGK